MVGSPQIEKVPRRRRRAWIAVAAVIVGLTAVISLGFS
jgi:hypothetical protein